MRGCHARLHPLRAAAWLVLLGAASPSWGARPPGVTLTVGHGWAVVSESRELSLSRGEQEVVLDDLPPEADLSTLTIRARRVPLKVLDWRWDTWAPGANTTGLSVDRGADLVRYRPAAREKVRAGLPGPAPHAKAVCRLDSPLRGKRRVQLAYLVRGFDWAASYDITVRGELTRDTEPLSVDLLAMARVVNPARRAFADARLVLVGSPEPAGTAEEKPPGFLMLEEGPLAALWQQPEQEPRVEHAYGVQERVQLAADGATTVPLARMKRAPAERLYAMTSAHFPLGSGDMKPLRSFLVFEHVPARGEAVTLPPGTGRIYLGSRNNQLLQEGLFPRTAAGGEMRIDLGIAEGVLGRRVDRGRSPVRDGQYEDAVEVLLRNERDSRVRVEVDEEPAVQLEWSVVRATARYRVEGELLRFTPTLEPRTELRILYRLRIRQPGL